MHHAPPLLEQLAWALGATALAGRLIVQPAWRLFRHGSGLIKALETQVGELTRVNLRLQDHEDRLIRLEHPTARRRIH